MTTNADSQLASMDSGSPPAKSPGLGRVFMGPHGLRAGWRLSIFAAIVFLLAQAVNFGLGHIPALAAWAKAQLGSTISATFLIAGEGLQVAALFFVVWIMTLIEKRSFADYGLPWNGAFGKRFWQGVPFGFLALSILLAVMATLHGFSLSGLEDHGADIVKYGLLFGAGFILVGIFEEFLCRGYLQATLGSGIGFWPAAILISILFGAAHLGNPGEAKTGAAMAGCFGLLAAFALKRTGNLWFPIGMHAAWDWGETYFYGVPDSGLLAQGRLLHSSSNGPVWLTGGTVGPEGSYLAFAALLLIGVAIHLCFPAQRRAS